MGDSDEEYDRRRRDKFRGERNDYENNRRPPPNRYDRGRGDRMSGGHWDRGSKRDYYSSRDQGRGGDRRESFGRGSSPPSKRSKRDWEGNDVHTWRGAQDSNALVPQEKGNSGAPTLMSFKDFIIQQEDDIDETEAVRRYQEYKVEFKRTQINDFFVMHKSEEWFEEKYHPIKTVERQISLRKSMRKRLRVFLDLWEEGYMDEISLQLSNSGAILKLLDRVILKLEGASEDDLNALDLPPVEEKKVEEIGDGKNSENKVEVKNEQDEEAKEPLPPGMEDEEEPLPPGMEDEEKSKPEGDDANQDDAASKSNDVVGEGQLEEKVEETKIIYDGSRMKHSLSVFMRSLPANISRSDVAGVCKRYPGFLRVAMSEPAPDRRFSRRCWATFESDVNIKDINWSMSNVHVKDTDLSPVVNRDVTNRIRPVNGVTCSPMTMQLDIRFIIELLKKLDEKHKLYSKEELNGHPEETAKVFEESEENEETDEKESKGDEKEEEEEKELPKPEEEVVDLPDHNPVLLKLPQYIENVISGLGLEKNEEDTKEYPLVVNDELMKNLDLILLYLRIVHCVDYYNGNEYVHEDEMPMRCGILHVRAAPLEAASKKDVYDWYNQLHNKLVHVLKDDEKATAEEAIKLGKKDEEIEVENFIKANTQELAKDKWLCPLSGKKFRGPEFVRKHILMKHNDNVDSVKTEVQYFNNYVYDTKRPCFPEARPRIGGGGGVSSSTHGTPNNAMSWSSHSNRQQPTFATPRSYQPSTYQASTPQSAPLPDTYGRVSTYPPKGIKRNTGPGYRDRRLIKYKDLDAPEESDFF